MKWIETVASNYHKDDCLIWPFGKYENGYGQLYNGGKKIVASRFICEKVHGSPPSPEYEAAHSCGNGSLGCVNPKHLSWKTRTDNEEDKRAHGTLLSRDNAPWSKLKSIDIPEIHRMSQGGDSQYKIAKKFGVSQSTISEVINMNRWA